MIISFTFFLELNKILPTIKFKIKNFMVKSVLIILRISINGIFCAVSSNNIGLSSRDFDTL